ncbi:MAG: hypothetical protein F6K41_39035 [Symploca sp. SIO3E6]|nr:hypothetical protein [Caldora sp. SIO3E6]
MTFEEEYEDVLQNIEFAIMEAYQEQEELIDAEVLTAIEWLIQSYGREVTGRSGSSRPLRGISKEVAAKVKQMCEWRLGRTPLSDEDDESVDEEMTPKTPEEIVACLKRIQSSIKFWTKKGGRQGYLNYIEQFFLEEF